MLRLARRPSPLLHRSPQCQAKTYTTSPPKIPIQLIAELRKQTHVSLSKAREALANSNLSVSAALEWLQHDLVATGLAKAAKVASRETSQGLIAQSVLSHGAGLNAAGGVRAAMVELNCETDFVSQNELFARLAVDIAHTAAFISEAAQTRTQTPEFVNLSIDELSAAPLIQHPTSGSSQQAPPPPGTTVATAIRDTIVKVGENISLARARSLVEDAPVTPSLGAHHAHRLGTYTHGARHGLSCGPISALALLRLRSPHLSTLLRKEQFRADLAVLERAIAQQLVGMDTLSVRPVEGLERPDQALYSQEFFVFPIPEYNTLSVEQALKKWSVKQGLVESEEQDGGVDVLDFSRWAVNQPETRLS
ncbi:hypothetical protein GALMADRAFT_132366 [Galerina marginata CBS 339.88]|uniref:Elongation factor Ts, mitochondrial n=1 Tax=Galerina marginata (strain CBS 339.88) TaxID=685588 RepID=A0A067TR57_GALM3|nr:hypothetical protein GALMADRAFT_132366 [Galerina marginata CBS 339.88]